jgi:hypothetical protein
MQLTTNNYIPKPTKQTTMLMLTKKKGKSTLGLLLLASFFCALCPNVSFAQGEVVGADQIVLEGFISADKQLESGKTYLIQHNVKVNAGATLTIPANVTLLFGPNTTIVVEGGLNVAGAPNSFVVFKSQEKYSQGTGIVVRGAEGADINVKYAKFVQLTTPFTFDSDWYRSNVTITNSEFREMNTGESNIMITSPLSSLYAVGDKKTTFTFSNNNFINNWGSIFIENLQDNVLDLRFNNNLVTNNVVYGIDKGIPSNTPVFGLYDAGDKRFQSELRDNSIFGNYQINAATDTIIREISVGIQGAGETFSMPNNFFRSTQDGYISSTFDHFYQNNSLPLLMAQPVLTKPSAQTHAHIYKVKLVGNEVMNYAEIPGDLPATNVTFEVYFNRPVTEFGETQLESVFYDTINNGIRIDPVNVLNGQWSQDNTVYTFSVADASFMKNELSYVIIKNFKDNEGFETPDFTIGQRKAINNYSKLYATGVASTYFPPAEVISNPGGFDLTEDEVNTLSTLNDLGDLSYLGAYTSLAKTWELGIMAGTMNYSGDLASKLFDKDEFKWAIGIYGQYNISKWFSARLAFTHGQISGSDLDEAEDGRRLRVANFRNNIYEGSLTFHFHLLQYGISKGERFSPAIFAGIGVFNHNPEARIFTGLNASGDPSYLAYDGTNFIASAENNADYVWVPLHSIGTEGQTSTSPDVDPDNKYSPRNPPKNYNLWQISIPFGLTFDFIINKSWTIGIEASFRFTLTDYLDDVSGNYWDRANFGQSVVDANPEITGKLGNGLFRDNIVLPNDLRDVNDGTGGIWMSEGQILVRPTNAIPTAAFLSNPSLANAIFQNPDGSIEYEAGLNDANTFPTARKGDSNRDWFAFFGVKATKIFGYNKYQKKQAKDNVTTAPKY